MYARLKDRLRAAREALFVGRTEERSFFRSALAADVPPFCILYILGPGGVGKTSLLRALQRTCAEQEIASTYLDARDVDPSPEAFLSALGRALDLFPGTSSMEAMAAAEDRHVLFIDTCEALLPLDSWLREHFLANLPEQTLLVMAGRSLLSKSWRTDPGWQALVHVLPLRNLDTPESRTFLERRAVPPDQHETVLDFTHGHPLAMSLVADLIDQQPGAVFQPQQAPGMLQTLMEQFVQQVPGPAHRAALEACALTRFTDEPLLQAMLAMPDVHELFSWLRGLSFIESGSRGLFPHDLAREVLAAELRWRNPEWHAELHQRARQFYTERLKQARGPSDREILSDYTYLHRDHPLVRPLFARLRNQWDESLPLLSDTYTPSSEAALAEMTERHEGADAAAIARHWLTRQPEHVTVYRDQAGTLQGFMMTLALDRTSPEDRAADPAAEQAWAWLETHAPLRPGETATLFRFWMARETYQEVSPVQSLIFLTRVRHYLNTPGLAYTFLTCRKPALWTPVFLYAGMQRLNDVDFEVGQHAYAVFGHDWRALPPAAWLDGLAARSVSGLPDTPPEPLPAPIVVLNRTHFEEAIWDAFRSYARPGKLRLNPLLRSRLVVDEVGAAADEQDRIEALRRLIAAAAGRLDAGPRDAKYYRALERTYLNPAPTQEQAAEQLDLPFSTFRRHLKRGLDRVTDLLWEREVGMGRD